MASWILKGVAAVSVSSAVASAAVACTGDDPIFTPVAETDAAGGVVTEGGSLVDATNLVDRDSDSAAPAGPRRACEGTPRLARSTSDRVLFEPYGILVDGTGALVGWEETITKRVAVPVDPTRRATVTGCCLTIGVGGGLAFAQGPELDVGTKDFSVYTQIKRLGRTLPFEASGGSAILKKPAAAFPFVGYALFLGQRDPDNGVLDLPAFQLQYSPQISVEPNTVIPADELLVVAGTRQSQMRMRIGSITVSNVRVAQDGLDLDNPEPLYLGGGGDNHFSGQLCAVVLNVGEESAFDTRATEVGALAH